MPENDKVLFKKGLSGSLPTTSSNIVNGAFYLTTDTNRIYWGNGGKLEELNQSVTIVPTVADLPTTGVRVGQFYYIAGDNIHSDTAEGGNNGNILAVATSSAGGTGIKWKQVNPDTNTNDHVTGFTIQKDTQNSTSQSLIYNWTVSRQDVNDNDLQSITGSFAIDHSDISALAGAAVGLHGAKSGNNLVISTTGAGAASTGNSVNLIPGNSNIQFSANGNNLTITTSDTKYHQYVNSTAKSIELRDADDNASGTTTYAAGTAINVSVAASNSDKDATVTYSHATVNVTTATTAVAPAFGESFTAISGITRTAEGHISGIQTSQVELPVPNSYSIDSITANSDGRIIVGLNDGVQTVSTTSGQVLYFTIGDASTSATNPKIYNQGNLSVYTRSEIDNMLGTLDGMTYKGLVPAGGLPTSGVHTGDTYKVGRTGIAIPGVSPAEDAEIGDMFIAAAKPGASEGANGTLAAADIEWTYIPSGDDYDSQYHISVSDGTITLSEENDHQLAETVTIAAGEKLTRSTTNNTITIGHDTINTTTSAVSTTGSPTTLSAGGKFVVIDGVTTDGYGHITNVQTRAFELPDPNLQYNLEGTASSGSTPGKVTLTHGSDNPGGVINFASTSMVLANVTVADQGLTSTVSFSHATATVAHTTATNTIPVSGNDAGFDAISGITVDSYGHVNGYTTQRYTLPDDVLVTLTGAVAAGTGADVDKKATVTMDLLDDNSNSRAATGTNAPAFSLSTSSLKISPTAASSTTPANIAIDIEWGSF